MNRRDLLKTSGLAALALGTSPFAFGRSFAPSGAPKRRVLMYSRSVDYQHDVIKRKGKELSLAEKIVTDLGAKHNVEVVCEKDGRVFLSKDLPTFDGFLFETQGDLTSEKSLDGAPPMTADGKKALLDAVAGGKGFVGCHCACDTFHSPKYLKKIRWENDPRDQVDPYIQMVGGEFAGHGAQQNALMHLVDPHFPGTKDVKDFEMKEEWYSIKNFAPDLHVILVQDTKGMQNFDYQRPNFPATWARLHHKGRVFYTSMGHRDDVWQNELFQGLLMGGLEWVLGNVKAEVPANIDKVTPHAADLPMNKK
jgi:type 1 glutamine amidotransferase